VAPKEGAPVPNLLHLDASIRATNSSSRTLSAAFVEEWRRLHPQGGYRYRDFAVDPVPHLTQPVREYLLDPAAPHPDVPARDRAASDAVAADVRWADTIVLGVPMYNYSVPSTVKAWLDHLIVPSYLVEVAGDAAPLRGRSVVAVTARGSMYAPGTGREGHDLQEPYLRAIFAAVGISDVHFVHAEMTMARDLPFLSDHRPLADRSMAAALAAVRRLAAGVGGAPALSPAG
jgi:FMN-dependent NADH-azoreductase